MKIFYPVFFASIALFYCSEASANTPCFSCHPDSLYYSFAPKQDSNLFEDDYLQKPPNPQAWGGSAFGAAFVGFFGVFLPIFAATVLGTTASVMTAIDVGAGDYSYSAGLLGTLSGGLGLVLSSLPWIFTRRHLRENRRALMWTIPAFLVSLTALILGTIHLSKMSALSTHHSQTSSLLAFRF